MGATSPVPRRKRRLVRPTTRRHLLILLAMLAGSTGFCALVSPLVLAETPELRTHIVPVWAVGSLLTFAVLGSTYWELVQEKSEAPPLGVEPKRRRRDPLDTMDTVLLSVMTPADGLWLRSWLNRHRRAVAVRDALTALVTSGFAALLGALATLTWSDIFGEAALTAAPYIGMLIGLLTLAFLWVGAWRVWCRPPGLVTGVVLEVGGREPLVDVSEPKIEPRESVIDLAQTFLIRAAGYDQLTLLLRDARKVRLAPDGVLVTGDSTEEITLPVTKRTARLLHAGERVVLLTYGDGRAFACLRNVARGKE